jgi:hypothetical protein
MRWIEIIVVVTTTYIQTYIYIIAYTYRPIEMQRRILIFCTIEV